MPVFLPMLKCVAADIHLKRKHIEIKNALSKNADSSPYLFQGFSKNQIEL